MVEFADFNHGPMETPMTEPPLPLIELLQKQDDGDFLRAVAEAARIARAPVTTHAPHDLADAQPHLNHAAQAASSTNSERTRSSSTSTRSSQPLSSRQDAEAARTR